MRRVLPLIAAMIATTAAPAAAHRVDEYLQATTVLVSCGLIQVELRLAPGVLVVPHVVKRIDLDGNGVISPAEEEAYVRRVVQDLSLSMDGSEVVLHPSEWTYPSMARMNDGRGVILIRLEAVVSQAGGTRQLRFENRHESGIGAYLVNALGPGDPGIQLISQERNVSQSTYELLYTQREAVSRRWSSR